MVPLIQKAFKELNSVEWLTFDNQELIHNWLSQMEKVVPDISNTNVCATIDIDGAVPVIDDLNPLIVKHN